MPYNNHLDQPEEPNLDQPAGDQQSMAQGEDRCLQRTPLAIGAVAVLVLVVLLLLQYNHPPPRYYACILSIPRVDSITLEFNISLSVECRKPMWGRTCLERGTGVAVAYHGLPVAFAATGAEVCSGWYKLVSVLRSTTVAARTSGLTSSVVDGVVDDARRGVGAFDVTFRIQSDRDHGKLVTCVVRPFSGEPATPCDVQYS